MLKNSFPPTALMPQVQTSTMYEVYKLTSCIYSFVKRHLAQNHAMPLIQISLYSKWHPCHNTHVLWKSYLLCLCSEYLDLSKHSSSDIQRQGAFCSSIDENFKILRQYSLHFPFFRIHPYSFGDKPKTTHKNLHIIDAPNWPLLNCMGRVPWCLSSAGQHIPMLVSGTHWRLLLMLLIG